MFRQGLLHCKHLTLHGAEHSEQVIKNLEAMLEQFMKTEDALNSTEILCLLASAWLHDVGLQVKGPLEDSAAVRADHHNRSVSYIEQHAKELDLADDHPVRRVIALVCQGHSGPIPQSNDYAPIIVRSDRVRVGLLTALLRLADELHLDYRRAPNSLRELLNLSEGEVSWLHWMKHHYIHGVMAETDRSGTIVFTVDAVVPDGAHWDTVIDGFVLQKIEHELVNVEPLIYQGSNGRLRVGAKLGIPRFDTSEEKLSSRHLNYLRYGPLHPFPEELQYYEDLVTCQESLLQLLREGDLTKVTHLVVDYLRTCLLYFAREAPYREDLTGFLRDRGTTFFSSKLLAQIEHALRFVTFDEVDVRDIELLLHFFNSYLSHVDDQKAKLGVRALKLLSGLEKASESERLDLAREAVGGLLLNRFMHCTGKVPSLAEMAWGWPVFSTLYNNGYEKDLTTLLDSLIDSERLSMDVIAATIAEIYSKWESYGNIPCLRSQ